VEPLWKAFSVAATKQFTFIIQNKSILPIANTHLGARDKQKTSCNEDALHGGLGVTELDTIDVEHRLAIRLNKCI